MTLRSASPTALGARWAALLLPLLAWVAAAPSRAAAPGRGDIDVVLARGQLQIEGREVDLPCSRQALARILGDPSRAVSSLDFVYVWDELGLFAAAQSDRGRIESIGVAMGEKEAEHWPRRFFAGRLEVDGLRLTSKTTTKELAAAKYWNCAPSQWLGSSGAMAVQVRTSQRRVIGVTLTPAASSAGYLSFRGASRSCSPGVVARTRSASMEISGGRPPLKALGAPIPDWR